MTFISFESIKFFIFASVVIYFIYDYIDKKRIKDEREEFLVLKAFEWMQKISLFCMTLLSVIYLFYPDMPAYVPLIVLVITTMYTEIFAKLYLRRKY
ncbi:MAG: hypothetical protein K0R29_937 [Pseudobdellovibrio sp.]|jgi:hypothetical protein|nr:hypothetical protein [Pseudobdellovibrio sp.]